MWKGAFFGGLIGSLFFRLPGWLIGTAIGYWIERKLGEGTGTNSRRRTSGFRRTFASPQERARVFCASAAAMLAKLAKADGRVSSDEIASVEDSFARLGFDASARAYAINVFRKAKDDRHTIYEYAAEFTSAVESVEVRELFYELLWDLACADGNVSFDELSILQRIPAALGIRSDWFVIFFRERLQGRSGYERYGRSSRAAYEQPRDALADAYATLGVSPSANNDEVKKAYRTLAKKHHPDLLRAQGLPEAMIGKATEKMGRINEAWARIRESRGI